MIEQDGTIRINEWEKGIGTSPHTGFGDMVNVDIHSSPGVLKIAPMPTKISASTVTGLVRWFSYSPSLGYYFCGDPGKTYTVNGTTVAEFGSDQDAWGGVVWRDYVFMIDGDASTGTNLVFDVHSTDGNTTENNWWTISLPDSFTDPFLVPSTGFVPAIVGQDDVIYFGYGNYVGSIEESTTFDPSDSGTYSRNSQALDLPEDYSIRGFTEIGRFLYIYAIKAGSNIAAIFPWDRTSSSFNSPIYINTAMLSAPFTRNNLSYFISGTSPKIMVTNGSTVEIAKELRVINTSDPADETFVYHNAVSVNDEGLLFGISTEDEVANCGVYQYKEGALTRYTISTGNDGSSQDLDIGAIQAKPDGTFLVSWDDGGTTGIDLFGNNGYRYTNYAARVDSPLYQVGTRNNRRTYETVEIQLAKELATGQGVKLSYRKNLNDSFTAIGTFDFATHGAVSSHSMKALIADAEVVQIRIESTTGASSTTTPEIREIIFT